MHTTGCAEYKANVCYIELWVCDQAAIKLNWYHGETSRKHILLVCVCTFFSILFCKLMNAWKHFNTLVRLPFRTQSRCGDDESTCATTEISEDLSFPCPSIITKFRGRMIEDVSEERNVKIPIRKMNRRFLSLGNEFSIPVSPAQSIPGADIC